MASQTATTAATPFLTPIERPKGIFLKMGYAYSRKQFGKVFSPLSVFCARMPAPFTRFYGKIGSLDKQLKLPPDTVKLLREQVATVNGCLYCADANRLTALTKSTSDLSKLLDELHTYDTSPLFTPKLRAALDYASELARDKRVSPTTFDALSAHYDGREICDIVWLLRASTSTTSTTSA
jgi:alkylhydroperoxidase family enzyme